MSCCAHLWPPSCWTEREYWKVARKRSMSKIKLACTWHFSRCKLIYHVACVNFEPSYQILTPVGTIILQNRPRKHLLVGGMTSELPKSRNPKNASLNEKTNLFFFCPCLLIGSRKHVSYFSAPINLYIWTAIPISIYYFCQMTSKLHFFS